jgi:hypothetical protein
MRVSVAIALERRQEVIEVEVAKGATVADAIAAARIAQRFPELEVERLEVGVWSRVASRATRLREGDRVELYRALKADPKSMRRARARLRTSPRSRSGP